MYNHTRSKLNTAPGMVVCRAPRHTRLVARGEGGDQSCPGAIGDALDGLRTNTAKHGRSPCASCEGKGRTRHDSVTASHAVLGSRTARSGATGRRQAFFRASRRRQRGRRRRRRARRSARPRARRPRDGPRLASTRRQHPTAAKLYPGFTYPLSTSLSFLLDCLFGTIRERRNT